MEEKTGYPQVEPQPEKDSGKTYPAIEDGGMKGQGDISSDEKSKMNGITWDERRIYKNIILVSLGFLGNFIAFQGLSRLQSSLHRIEGMGVINSSVLYASMVLSCMFVPRFMIRYLGHKWTICVSIVGYMTWMAANGYAVWGTMVTASIIVGLCAAPLWTAQCSYFTKLGVLYSKITNEKEETVITRFFGLFFMFFQMSSIVGSVLMATILNSKPENGTEPTDDELRMCGANDNPWRNVTNVNLKKPEPVVLWTLVGVFLGIATLAVVMVGIFMDPLPKELEEEDQSGQSLKKQTKHYLIATVKQLRHKEQLLLIPLTMYSGFEQAMYNAEWTKSFISCSLGIWQVGLVTLPYGIVNTTVSFLSGRVIKYTGRIPLFTAAMIMDLCIQITLMAWIPSLSTTFALYIISGMWGFSDAIWQTQINGMYGCVFKKESEAAFSNYRMWESAGFIIAFAWSNFLATNVKIYITTSILCVAMVGYYVVEYLMWKDTTKVASFTPDPDPAPVTMASFTPDPDPAPVPMSPMTVFTK